MSTVVQTEACADPNAPTAAARGSRPRRDPVTVPAYCRHRTKNRAYVRLSGDFIYLGEYGSPESHAAYQRVVAEWLARGRVPRAADDGGPSVNEVLLDLHANVTRNHRCADIDELMAEVSAYLTARNARTRAELRKVA